MAVTKNQYLSSAAALAASVLTLLAATLPLAAHAQWKVDGRYLKDPSGDKLVMRGYNDISLVNSAIIFPEIAKTGSNTVRIEWDQNSYRYDNELAAALTMHTLTRC